MPHLCCHNDFELATPVFEQNGAAVTEVPFTRNLSYLDNI